ncbi:MAG: hypothetical protein ACOCP8_08640, partial [archaeon]
MNIAERLLEKSELSNKEKEILQQYAKYKNDFEIEEMDSFSPHDPILQNDKTNYNNYKLQFNNILKDLTNIYYYTNNFEKTFTNNKTINKNNIVEIKKKLKNIKNKLKSCELLIDSDEDFVDIHTQDFDGNPNQMKYNNNIIYFNDHKNNTYFDKYELCKVNKVNKGITLNPISTLNPNIYDIELKKQTGGKLNHNFNNKFNIKNILSLDSTKIWSEVIYTDEPFEIEMIDPIFSNHKNGALAKIVIRFNKVTPINEISLSPFYE